VGGVQDVDGRVVDVDQDGVEAAFRSGRLARQTKTLAQQFSEKAPDFQPRLAGTDGQPIKAIVQRHCHQHAVLGFGRDQKIMESVGLQAEDLQSGCCGLAGNFVMNPEHGTCRWPAPNRPCCPPSATPARTPSCSPTGSPAAPRSRTPAQTMSTQRPASGIPAVVVLIVSLSLSCMTTRLTITVTTMRTPVPTPVGRSAAAVREP
jgi:hypothetical protein